MSSLHDSQPSSDRTASGDDFQGHPQGNGLCLQLAPFRLEHIEDYEYGGHHPVHLGDEIGDDGRYVVVHKLGHGGSANVWLCRDSQQPTPSYVAVKALMAESSTDDCPELRQIKLKNAEDEDATNETHSICLPLDRFRIDGPNGKHFCFVYPVLGPKASFGIQHGPADPDQMLRNMCFRVVQATAFLHEHEICHGGMFRPDQPT